MTNQDKFSKISHSLRVQIQQSCASAGGAIIVALFVSPFDVIKTRLQMKIESNLAGGSPIPYKYSNNPTARKILANILKNEGAKSLWRGLTPSIILALPNNIIYFTTYDYLKQNISTRKEEFDIEPEYIPLLVGPIARFSAVCLTAPMELIRTHMNAFGRQTAVAVGTWDIVTHIKTKGGGFSGLWRGLGPSLLRDIPFSAIYWYGLEQVKKKLNTTDKFKSDSIKNTLLVNFISGTVSGIVAASVTTPIDVIKTQMQIVLAFSGPTPECRADSIFFRILKEDGIRGLFRGIVPRVIKVAPSCAIMISSYEGLKIVFAKLLKL